MLNGSTKRALQGGILMIYSGAQPTTADDAPNGSLLNTITLASGAHTPEVISTGTVTLTGGGSGTVDTITVDSINILGAAVAFNGTLAQTATDTAAQITNNLSNPEYFALAVGAVITIYAMPGTGTQPNTKVVAATSTTITTSTANMASGVASANGLTFGTVSSGALSKSGIWSGVASADGTPGWYRYVRAAADAAGASTTAIRLDGNISTTNADLNINPCTSVNGVTLTIDTYALTEPAA
jgi:hypothetical protein